MPPAASFFEKKVEPKSFPMESRKSSHFTIENGVDFNQNTTSIVLQVYLNPFKQKSLQYTRNPIAVRLRFKSPPF